MIKTIGAKVLYNLDDDTLTPASDWVRTEVKGLKTFDAPQMSNALRVKSDGRGRSAAGHIGYMGNNGNSPYDNATYVYILSECSSRANGLSILPSNFRKVCALFGARKTVKSTWLNQKDEYMAPDESHSDYQGWNDDCVVYAIFNGASNQSSLRNVNYKGSVHQIKNEWFWMDHGEIKELADAHSQDDLYHDACQYGKRSFVCTELASIGLSHEAIDVLEMASNIVRETIKYRRVFDESHPEYNINTWDAGWYQVKALAKEYAPDMLREFNTKYAILETKVREGVTKFGFLYNL